MNPTQTQHSYRFVERQSASDVSALRVEMLKAGTLPVTCNLGTLAQRLYDIKALRFMAPPGVAVQLLIDHDVSSACDLETISLLIKEQHFAGTPLDSDVAITILSDLSGVEMLMRNFRNADTIQRSNEASIDYGIGAP